MEFSNELEIEHLVLKQVASLNKQGLWKRLKQVPLPKDPKCHWDYVLEEMQWMSKIIAEERILKEKNTKKLSKMIQNHFRTEELKASRNEKHEEIQRRKNANQISKMVKQFWSNAGKLVEYKFKSILDIGRRRLLDEKLSKVLSTSEKFAEEISTNLENQASSSVNMIDPEAEGDEDFVAASELEEEDVEDTIEREEKMTKLNAKDYEMEINELQDENDLSYEELLAKYSGYLEANYPECASPDITDTQLELSQRSPSASAPTAATNGKEKSAEESKPKKSISGSPAEPKAKRGYNLRLRSKRSNEENQANLENNNDPENNYSSDNSVGLGELVKEDLVKDIHAEVGQQGSAHTF